MYKNGLVATQILNAWQLVAMHSIYTCSSILLSFSCLRCCSIIQSASNVSYDNGLLYKVMELQYKSFCTTLAACNLLRIKTDVFCSLIYI